MSCSKKTKMKLWLLLISCMVVCVLGIPQSASAAVKKQAGQPVADIMSSENDVIDSGVCGENLTWTFTGDGVLTISGTGDMYDYDGWLDEKIEGADSFPGWVNNNLFDISEITSVVIESGVTSIGSCAFISLKYVTDITVPDGVTRIGSRAFYSGEGVRKISLPDSVTEIGSYAFAYCTSLSEINLPAGLTEIENGTFQRCDALESIEIPDGVTEIGQSAFWYAGLTSVTIPDSVTTLGAFAFEDCTSLASVTIGSGLSSCGILAFGGCTGMTELTLSEGITQLGDSMFDGCTALTSVTVPESVTTVIRNVFENCTGLTEAVVKSIGDDSEYAYPALAMFYNCTSLESVTLGDSITFVADEMFYNCTSLSKINIPDGVTSIGAYAFYNCSMLPEIVIPDSVSQVGECSFKNCAGLTNVTFGSGITWMGNEAFAYCTSLEAVALPDSVTELADQFYGCSNLADITLSFYTTTLSTSAFYDTAFYNNEENWEDGVLYLDRYLLAADPETVTGEYRIKDVAILIASYAFESCDGLESLIIPNDMRYMNYNAFYNCTALTSITFEGYAPTAANCYGCFNSLTATAYYPMCDSTWTSAVMKNCGGTIIWEKYVPDMASGVCGDDLSWMLTVDDGDLLIAGSGDMYDYGSGDAPWYELISYIKTLDIDTMVTSIGSNAFCGGTAITSAELPASVTSIGRGAFYGCTALTEFTIPENVESVGDRAFYGCANLANLTVPESLTDIGDSAFRGCYGLADEDGFVIVNHILFDYCGDGGDIVIPDTVTEISGYAFQDNSDISGVTIPDSVLSVGGAVFYGCSNLSSVVLPGGITEIPHIMFYYCTSLTSITIPEGVTTIGASAFAWCTNLVSVELPDGLTFIDEAAFSYCTSLTSIDLPGTLETTGWYAFNHCTSLESVAIGDGIQYITANSFQYCSSLTSIVIPASIIQIGYRAFDSCTSLTEIYFEGDAPIFQYSEYDDEDDSMSIFRGGIVATAYYPEDNETWTEDVLQNYGGTLTWVAYTPVTEPYTITEALSDALAEAVGNISAGVRSVQQIVFNEDCSGELTLTADEAAAGEKSDKVLLLQTALEDEDDSNGTDAGSAGNDASTGSETVLELVLTGSSMIDENGEITFNITSTADGILVYGVNGDVTGDEKVDASDTLAILRGVSGRTALDVVQEGFSDVNLDGQVNSNDLLAVVKYVSGRTSTLN